MVREFTAFLSWLTVGPALLLREQLGQMRYIGPLRRIPPRGLEVSLTKSDSAWSDGMAAWETLVTGSQDLVERVSDWMSLMRKTMLSREDLVGAVLIGGMEGVDAELALFQQYHPNAFIVPVAAAGGAAQEIAIRVTGAHQVDTDDVDFASLFHRAVEGTRPVNRPKRNRPPGS